eukprot:gene8029-12349_t
METLLTATRPLDAMIVEGWGYVVENTTPRVRAGLMPIAASIGWFWVLNVPLMLFNFYPKSSPLERFKIQKGVHVPWATVADMLALVLFNHATSLCMQLFASDLAREAGLADDDMNNVPTFLELVACMFACAVLYDTFFYFAHCLMHTKWMYYKFHAVHHKAKTSIGIVSSYFHPVDYWATTLCVIVPPALVHRHVLVSIVWMTIIMTETIIAHSGYRVPYVADGTDHDFHHLYSNHANKNFRFANMGSFFLVRFYFIPL